VRGLGKPGGAGSGCVACGSGSGGRAEWSWETLTGHLTLCLIRKDVARKPNPRFSLPPFSRYGSLLYLSATFNEAGCKVPIFAALTVILAAPRCMPTLNSSHHAKPYGSRS